MEKTFMSSLKIKVGCYIVLQDIMKQNTFAIAVDKF